MSALAENIPEYLKFELLSDVFCLLSCGVRFPVGEKVRVMVKCPKGTPSQAKANLTHINKPSVFTFDSSFFSWVYDPVKGQMVYVGDKEHQPLAQESDESELDSNKADKRSPPTARDELVYYFISCFLDILLESWDGKPCVKPKLFLPNESEELGEDLGPCETSIVSSTAEYLKDLFQKRSTSLSKEKLQKSSESTEFEYLNEEDFESFQPSQPWKTFVPDEDVHFVLLNGAWYKGRVSRRLMEGEGFYFWEDGATFQGEFEGGCVTGKGRLEFPDLSVYEGGVYKAFRHGEGMFCFSESPIMYSGQWWLGKKHGHGLIVYNDPSEGHNFYRGQWHNGVKEGFGFRQYPSGAKYIGFWVNGKRHGRGVMFWSNNDIYRGEWKDGFMHGYGEYTWNGFINKSLSYPASNTYRGYWANGKRNGRGLFELKTGPLIETAWVENMKEGLGAVICVNGSVVASENLFVKDKPGVYPMKQLESELSVNVSSRIRALKKNEEQAMVSSLEKLKPISIPIHSPVHTLNLSFHTQEYMTQKKEKILKSVKEWQVEFLFLKATPEVKFSEKTGNGQESNEDLSEEHIFRLTVSRMQEEKQLRSFIIFKMASLKSCYDYYATLACEEQPTFKCVLLRLFLWQMLIDAEVTSWNMSLVDIDVILACKEYLLIENPHDPFERIQFWQFIQILIILSWLLYGQYVSDGPPLVNNPKVTDFLCFFENRSSKAVLKAGFEYFIENDVFRGRFGEGWTATSEHERRYEESDFAPMEAMYNIYCSVGEPHSARDFVNAVCRKENEDERPFIVQYFEKLPFYKVDGKNALTVAGELRHIPRKEPFNFPEIFPLVKNPVRRNPGSELSCFNGLKAKKVVGCLMKVCAGLANDGCIVNMDYQLTFLEFYKTIILCTKLQLKLKAMNDIRDKVIADYKMRLEEYKRQMSELEKLKETPVVSRRKSRQFSDVAKKGKK